MTTVYPQTSDSVTFLTVDDLIAYLFPKVERYVTRRYHTLSYDYQQDLLQAGLTAVWEKAKRESPKAFSPAYWMGVARYGILNGLDALRRETGVWSNAQGTRIENRVDYASDIAPDPRDSGDGLEVAERLTRRTFGPSDPEGGRLDARLDFEQLATQAFSLLTPNEREDCQAVARFLALGEGSAEAFYHARGWSQHHYKKTLNRLKDVFYQAVGKERPGGRPAPIDQAKVLALYQEGYGYERVARLVGCSKKSVANIVTAAKKEHADLATLPKRVNQHSTHPPHHIAAQVA